MHFHLNLILNRNYQVYLLTCFTKDETREEVIKRW
jgi:hypothetical protein